MGSAFSAIVDGLYFFSFIVEIWRFILSPKYRRMKKNDWQEMRSMLVAQEIMLLFVGFLISILLFIGIAYAFFSKPTN